MLSGFIIAYNYQEKLKDNKIDKRTFWVARIARIYPLHWLTLFIAAILGSYVIASGTLDWLKHFLAHFDKCLYSQSRLLFLFQQPFMEFML